MAASGVAAVAAAAGHWVPSVVSLGQWLPVRSVVRGACTWRGPAGADGVALTFDDGPDPVLTPDLLERLDRLGARATFFCLGASVARHPDLVREAARRGHTIATHGHHHLRHLLCPPWVPGRDLDLAIGATVAAVGRPPRWFRPPYGQCSGATLAAARRRGLGTVLWSAWGREWARPDLGRPQRAAAVVAKVRRGVEPGGIVLLHDSDATSPPGSARAALDALEPIVDAVRAAGLRTLTLDELLGAPEAVGA